jgi:hypothetical protein
MSRLKRFLHVPRVFLAWALLAAALLLWHPAPARLVHMASTNLANLGRHPVLSIALSVFTLAHGWAEWATWVGLFVVWVLVERSLGWRRTLLAFVAGHVLATLGVAAIESFAVYGHLAGGELVHVAGDVGASYGFMAVAAAGIVVGVRADRRWLAAVPVVTAMSVIDVGWWTILGHGLAIGVGAATGLVTATRSGRGLPIPAASVTGFDLDLEPELVPEPVA